MKKFEYIELYIGTQLKRGELHTKVNTMGAEGWELVSVLDYSRIGLSHVLFEADSTSGFVLFFKRELIQN